MLSFKERVEFMEQEKGGKLDKETFDEQIKQFEAETKRPKESCELAEISPKKFAMDSWPKQRVRLPKESFSFNPTHSFKMPLKLEGESKKKDSLAPVNEEDSSRQPLQPEERQLPAKSTRDTLLQTEAHPASVQCF